MDFQMPPPENHKLPDTSETLQISSLALLKMLKHGRAGIPLEVMGLLLGEFVDDFTIKVVDVFSMPQSGSSVTVEDVDPVYQTEMMDLLKMTGRNECVVGWYHSHPGFGCWLSNVDMSTQSSFEQLNKRAVAVVIDPIQSVKGKVVLDAFRLMPNQMNKMTPSDARETTRNIGYYNPPSLVASVHGLNKMYYSFYIEYRKTEMEEKMLLNMNKKSWIDNLTLKKIDKLKKSQKIKSLAENYLKMKEDEKSWTKEELSMYRIGKLDYRKHLLDLCEESSNENTLNKMLTAIHKKILGK
uniref:LOW QUALITY PROTEIN: uncharacterized protein LOC131102141 n=1 Tax=Doryrhamphus excisus TaxID=161450 RepID=UPI0025AE9F00|nr:LOW QUALITY PROTEIN: uncharacterized protein LOC131102141 [Doryrhamphus excisus]